MKCMKATTSLMAPLSAKNVLLSELLNPMYIPPKWEAWFHIQPTKIGYVQYTVHFPVKLKSCLLKLNIVFPMGNYSASAAHLHALTANFKKNQHGLKLRDINHKDKQKFQAVILTSLLQLTYYPRYQGMMTQSVILN